MAQRVVYRTRRVRTPSRRGARRALGGARGIFGKLSGGIGGGAIAQAVSNMVAPQFSPVAGLAGSWLGGGLYGVVGKVAYDAMTGQGGLLGGLGGLFGGGGQTAPAVEAI